MGVYPAAIELNRNGFDLPALLSQPGYTDGGPNVHATSLGTWAIAITIAAFGDLQTALPFLHIANFALAGTVAAGVYRITRRWAAPPLAVLTGAASILYPPLMAQATNVYIDLGVAAAVTWAIVLAEEGRMAWAVALATLGAWIKPTGLIVVPIVLIAFHIRGQRNLSLVLAGVLPCAAAAASVIGGNLARSASNALERVVGNAVVSRQFLAANPDFLAISGTVVVLALILDRQERRGSSMQRAVTLTAARITALYFFLIFASPLFTLGIPTLPRYSVILIPTLVAGLASGLEALVKGGAVVVVSAVALVFAIGLDGRLYSSSENGSFLAERSLDYRQDIDVQKASLLRLQELSLSMPIFYDHFTHYRFAYPEMGWSTGSPMAGIPIELEPGYWDAPLAELPSTFALSYQHAWLGGQRLYALLQRALADDGRRVAIETFSKGGYEVVVAVVRTTSQDL